MLTSASFIVRKERGRKVVSLLEPERPNKTDKAPKSKKKTAGLIRRQEVARSVVRYFKAFPDRKTVSVFGAKNVTKEELRLMSLVAKRAFEFPVYFFGVAEHADSGPHGHFVAFKEIKGEPQPLTKKEEDTLCLTITNTISAWRNRPNKKLRPSRFLLRRLPPTPENSTSTSFYRVPKILAGGRSMQSGIGHFAIGYTLKSLLTASKSSSFIASTGLTQAIQLVRSKQEVRQKERKLWTKKHSTYRFDLLSIVALEAEKQLRYREPKEVSVYIKYGRVFVETQGGRLKLHRNVYLLAGLELLRRDLKEFSSASVLRRAVSKVCTALCPEFRSLTSENLHQIARQQRDAIVWASQRKQII